MATFTWDQIANYLTTGFWTWQGVSPYKLALDASRAITVNITGLSANAQQMAIQALQQWSSVTGINFVQTTSASAQIRFQSSDPSGAYSYSTGIVNGIAAQSVVNIPDNWWPYTTGGGMSTNGYMFMTYIHEIGHALGLGHPGPYNGSATFTLGPLQGTNGYNLCDNDSWSATIMSYFDQIDNTFIPGSFAYLATIMPADIIAIQNLYGAGSIGYQTGNTVWGPGGNIDGYLQHMLNMRADLVPDNPAFFDNLPMSFTIYDTGGIDTLDMSAFSMSQEILLTELEYSNLFGLVDNVIIARGTVIENAIGGSGNDTIIGNNVANILEGRGGADTINGGLGDDTLIGGGDGDTLIGGDGNDTASYAGSAAGVTVLLTVTGPQTSAGDASGDRLSGIENLIGSSFTDTLVGNSGVNNLNGGAGNDFLIGGAGADVLNGGTGSDFAYYFGEGTGVNVNLQTGIGTGGNAQGDTYVSIENVAGTDFADILLGNSENNTLWAFDGDDVIYGYQGSDYISGGGGADFIIGGFGADVIDGGAGVDFAYYYYAGSGVTVNLQDNSGTGGEAEGDTFSSIENVAGTNFADLLVGDGSNNTLWGFDGIDILYGNAGNDYLSAGNGNDTLIGGTGADTVDGGDGVDMLYFYYASAGVSVNLEAGSGSAGEAAGDIYYNLESVAGTNFTDVLVGNGQDNVLWGFDGIDRITGGGGNDTIAGGTGADHFVYNANAFGADTVTDFEDGIDKIEISSSVAASISSIGITQLSATSVLLTFGSGTVRLNSASPLTMTADDFVFV